MPLMIQGTGIFSLLETMLCCKVCLLLFFIKPPDLVSVRFYCKEHSDSPADAVEHHFTFQSNLHLETISFLSFTNLDRYVNYY